jgi:hypothetical protein
VCGQSRTIFSSLSVYLMVFVQYASTTLRLLQFPAILSGEFSVNTYL